MPQLLSSKGEIYMTKKIKRFIAGTLSLIMGSTVMSSFPAFADDVPATAFNYDGYSVSYNVTNSWGDTEVVSITLTNTGDNPIENWMLYFDPNGDVTSIWDAQISYTTDEVPYFINSGYNSTIAPDSSVTFSYCVDDCEEIPSNFVLCNHRANKAEGYTATVVVDNTWGENCFNGSIVLTNNTDKAIRDWELTFDTNFTITEISSSWSGTMTLLEPYSYMLKGSYTNVIEPNGNVTLGFSGVMNGTPTITDTTLTEVVANEELINFHYYYPEGAEIFLYGEYNETANEISLEWTTDYDGEDFEIWESDDNVNYTLVTTVHDTDSYIYPVNDSFTTKYLKVSANICNEFEIESIPVVISFNGETYTVDFLDSDTDGIADIYENIYGTDPHNADTDSDGLTDYQEIYVTYTDPLVYDSVTEGVSDANADSDGDGLSNTVEIGLGTNPRKIDTDNDGLSDYDEVNTHHTNPLQVDTDNDGLNDGDEVTLGLNPLTADSDNNGVLDKDEYIEQEVSASRYESGLLNNNLAVPSITVSAKGNANSNISVSEYNGHLKSNSRSYVGKLIEISNSDVNSGSISFTLDTDYTLKQYTVGENTTNGLVICYCDGENTIPLDTTYNAEARTLTADIDDIGIYYVLDVISWLDEFGIDPSDYFQTGTSSVRRNLKKAPSTSISTVQIKGQVDIVFAIDTTGSMSSAISNVKNNINSFVDALDDAGIKASFALVEYRDVEADGANTTKTKSNDDGGNWFKDVDDFKAEIAKLSVGGGGDAPESAIDALEMAHRLDMRQNSQKFIILVTDAGYKIANNYGVTSLDETVATLVSKKINVSVVSNSSYSDDYHDLYDETGGIFANINGNFKEELLSIADVIEDETNNGSWIALNNSPIDIIKLDAAPTVGSTVDTDGDGVPDIDELISNPTQLNVDSYVRALGLPDDYNLPTIPVYKYHSNPILVDTDYDGIDDDTDTELGNEFTFTMYDKIRDDEISYPVTFEVNYKSFFKENTEYHKDLAILGTIYSELAYKHPYILSGDNDLYSNRYYISRTYSNFGLGDYEDIKLSETYHDDDISEMFLGHRKVEYDGKTKEIIVATIRGTDSTIEEWSSNFDVGANTDNYWDRDNPYWKNKLNHKGFDVAANRLYDFLIDYINSSTEQGVQKTVFLVGHSRGAAIANIIGSELADMQTIESFVYTFATPNTTTDSNYRNYETIFNIVNDDDLVPMLPLDEPWNFHKYGHTLGTSIHDNYENKFGSSEDYTWEYLFKDDYNYNGNLNDTIKAFKKIANNRNDLYTFSEDKDTIYSYKLPFGQFLSDELTTRRNKYGTRIGRFCEVYSKPTFANYSINVKQSPAFLMMVLAELASTKCHTYENGIDEIITYTPLCDDEDTYARNNASFYVAKKYKNAKKEFIHSGADSREGIATKINYGGMVHSHMMGTYYLLANDTHNRLEEQ